jgi:hypothetical protein
MTTGVLYSNTQHLGLALVLNVCNASIAVQAAASAYTIGLESGLHLRQSALKKDWQGRLCILH